jgi:hypothetical protein
MGIAAISANSAVNQTPSTVAVRAGASAKTEFSKEEQAQIDKLKARDTAVRAHEAAHLAAAGGLATSGPTFTYQRGPNGVSYAIGGEVNINTSPGRTPEETLSRARTIAAAALAPADPSGQDRAVAAQARQMEITAQAELSAKQQQVGRAYGEAAKSNTIDTFA